ncbi:flagellar export chaperone FliS [Paenibacillus sp. WQ 127069]|uniref:Flagellar secretion chaperone FliS n=1 Tax=Paenibacillus baimaensis TaxID=2982185 RepID=A0ABT2UEA6_9BACL|nr:flagellar export chaperone FliS [Paenibacillus sp. WQ 127069]MCU6792937.1 flagellar export chaperone FliS [Paenibacillus sp. WQ 127069]
MMNLNQNKYMENSIRTASPTQLLIMLCDGAIRFCKLGMEAIRKKEYIEAGSHIGKVQNIINEFVLTLDVKSPVADGLLKLYDYLLHRLIESNIKKDIAIIEEVVQFLVDLKETWISAATAIRQGNTSGAQHV